MNVAIYDPSRGHKLIGHEFYPGCTQAEVREMALLVQIEAQSKSIDLGGSFLVAWENLPSQYISVMTLGDNFDLDETMLNSIESLARTRH